MFSRVQSFLYRRQRALLNLSVLVVFAALLGVRLHTNHNMNRLAGLTQALYEHPFTVNTAVLRVKAGIIGMHRSMKDVALAENSAELEAAVYRVNQLEQDVFEDFDLE
jgi:methyl-accepting chemotaxis protein